MQVKCVKAFGYSVPGDLAEVPDGAATDPEHWEPVTPAAAADPPPASPPLLPVPPVSSAPVVPEGM